MNLAIDTNILSDFFDADPEAVAMIKTATTVYVPVIAVAEYKHGIYAGSKKKRNLELLEAFLGRPSSKQVFIDDMTTEQYAALKAFLRQRGTPIPANDVWIAAICVQHDLPLLTRDKHFQKLPQITLLW